MNEDRLSELYRRGTRPPLEGRGDCLDAATLLAAIEGEPQARERAADHAGRCSACAEDLRLALGLEGLETARRREAPSSVRWLRLAAAIAIGSGLALAALRLGRGGLDEPATIRGEADAAWAATTPADGATFASPPSRLSWNARPTAVSYAVTIVDEESTLIWESPRGPAPSADLPPETIARLSRGGIFFWRVTVWGPRGPSTSPLFRFEVRR